VFLHHDQFIAWVSDEARALNYRNFKSEVAIVRGKGFSRILGQVWVAMHQAEDAGSRDHESLRTNNHFDGDLPSQGMRAQLDL